jgi:hypothetical protein
MAPEDESAFEAEQQVLPDRVDLLEAAAVEFGCDPGRGGSRVRRRDLHTLADERLEASCSAVERIALGHL